MSRILLASLLLSVNSVLGGVEAADFDQHEPGDSLQVELRNATAETSRYLGELFRDTWDLATSAASYMDDSVPSPPSESHESGRGYRLKYKRAELRFVTKALLFLKVMLGVVLPFGIIASKILSWKAVTLSLMAFMLAKILFVKNLLAGKNTFSVTPTNLAPPVFIQGGPNDLFWKRQGEAQAGYQWSSS